MYSLATFFCVWGFSTTSIIAYILEKKCIYVKVYKMSCATTKDVGVGKIFDTAVTKCGWYIDNSLATLINTVCPSCH